LINTRKTRYLNAELVVNCDLYGNLSIKIVIGLRLIGQIARFIAA